MATKPLDKIAGAVPKDLRQLLAFVPTRGLDALEWRPLLKKLRGVSWQLATGSGVKHLAASLEPLVSNIGFEETDGRSLHTLTAKEKKRAGDTILHLYFTQFKNPDGLFLDLRTARFTEWDGNLYFRGSGLHTRLDPEFRLGMMKLYRGFYEPNAELLDQALYEMGFLHEDLSADDSEELGGLLQSHFGSQQRAQTFAIDSFKDSFDALFDFFIDHDYTLRSDFVMLGFYLITLYLALEELGQRHDVKAICQEVLVQ